MEEEEGLLSTGLRNTKIKSKPVTFTKLLHKSVEFSTQIIRVWAEKTESSLYSDASWKFDL